ncbi:MAG: beta strand repeat-containing protein [Gammaproteobacteria bacterium]
MSIPDFALGQTVDFKFTTRAFATGIPTTLAGTPVVDIYEDNSVTQITASETLTADFDSVTGLNNLRVVATSGNGYESGKSYAAVITTGTVGGVSVVGEVVAQFTIDRQSLRPTTAGNTLDVTSAGTAGIDWGNVENPTTAVDLSATDIQLADTTTTVTNQVTANVTAISGDSTAADNLEATYDGTGYSDGVAPATQSQVDNIGSASGGAFNFAATTDNTGGAIKGVTFVGTQTGTFANTEAEDGTYHQIDHSGNAIDIVYSFPVGGARSAVEVTFKGYLTSSNDVINLQAYDFVGADWETRKVITGQNGTTNITEIVALLTKHTGTGADLGTVLIRFQTIGQTSPVLQVDEVLVSAVNTGQSVGYANGRIWIDTVNGTAGTESFVNGTADNPVDSIADAITISSNIGLTAFNVATNSSITLAATAANYSLTGDNWTLAFGGQSIAGAMIDGATISGTFTNTDAILENCIVNAITGPGVTMRRCFFNEVTITNNGTAGWFLNDCRSRVAGTGSPNFDFGAAAGNTSLNLRAYSGGIELENMGQAGTDNASVEGNGQITLNANCAGGSLSYRGNFKFTDNSGAVDVLATSPVLEVVDQGTAQAGTANTITLAATASATDGQYDPGQVILIAGTGAGQARSIIDYDGTTKVAVIDKDWRTNPDSTTSYVVQTSPGQLHVNEGQAQAGAASTITLNAVASATDDIYIGQTVFLVGGTGQDQSRVITDYNGTTKVATVHKAWNTNPDATTSYVMLPLPAVGDSIINIEADTNELQGDWTDGGRLDLILDAIAADAASLNDTKIPDIISLANINGEMVDVITIDTIAELAQAAPSATPSLANAVMLLYMAMRNKVDITNSVKEIHDNAGTVITKKTLSDDGTTYSEAEMVTGP